MAARKFVVIGGGISGLSAAFKLAENPRNEVVLLEASRHVGGWIKTIRAKDGALVELGPRSLRTVGVQGKFTLDMVSRLGLDSEVLAVLPSNKAAGRRFIYTEKHGMVELPSGPSWLIKTKPPFTRPLLSAVIRELRTPPSNKDESVHTVISSRLNKEVADYIGDPMCHGIFAGNAHELSFRACFPRFNHLIEKHGSLLRGMVKEKSDPVSADAPELVKRAMRERWQFYTLRNGLSSFPERLAQKLKEVGVKVLTEHPCSHVTFSSNGAKVVTDGSESKSFHADHIISAVRSDVLASMLGQEHADLASMLCSIPFVDVGVVNVQYQNDVMPSHYKEAFGYLVPPHVQSKVLGVVFDSSVFPSLGGSHKSGTRLTVMLGGHLFFKLYGDANKVDATVMTKAALESLQDHLGIKDIPIECITSIHQKCIPQYTIGHSERAANISAYLTKNDLPLTALGSSYNGASVADCVYNSYGAMSQLVH